MQNNLFPYDVFLSHNSRDKAAARQVAQNLRARGLRVWFDEWVIMAGDSIPAAIENGLDQSRVLLLLMSKAAFESDWVTLERQAVLFRDPANQGRRFVPIRMESLENAQIPIMLRQFRSIDCSNESSGCYEQIIQTCRPTQIEVASTINAATQRLPTVAEVKLTAREKRIHEARRMILDRLGEQFELAECIHSDKDETLFRARDLVLQREVSLKLPNLPPCDADIVTAQFFQKMRRVSMINHHNIVPVFGGFRIDHLPVLVLGYVPGVTLADLIARTGAQPLMKVRKLLLDVASALDYSHRRGAVHHRLRPVNILLDEEGNMIVTPMLFARNEFTISNRRDMSDRELIRLSYESPETFFKAAARPDRSDQYSLGMIAFEMLVGRNIIGASSFSNLVERKRRLTIPEFQKALREISCPSQLQRILLKMLAADPSERYESFHELVDEVRGLDDASLGLARAKKTSLGTALCAISDSFEKLRVQSGFFLEFYRELITSQEIRRVFEARGMDAITTRKQHWLLREALELLIAFADEKNVGKRPRVLSRIAETHAHYRVTVQMYDTFLQVFLRSVRLLVEGQSGVAISTKETSQLIELLDAWKIVLTPGLDFLKQGCA